MSEAHYATVVAGLKAELEFNRAILEREIETGIHTGQLLSTAAWERYRSQLRPGPRLRDRLKCLFRGHDDYICEATCCQSRTAWCVVCGRDTPAGHKRRSLHPAGSPT